MATKKKSGHWMEKAFSKNKGKFTRKAKKAGKSTMALAREKKNAKGKLGKEARLALIGKKFGGKHHKKSSQRTRRG